MTLGIRRFLSVFRVDYPKRLAYIWQASEYSVRSAIGWWLRIGDFSTFTKRGDLVLTRVARVVRLIVAFIAGGYIILNALSIIILHYENWMKALHLIIAILLYPAAVVILSIVPIMVLKLIKRPFDYQKIKKARTIFHEHPGLVIAVAGSYGKTSMKELLVAALTSGKVVAATEGNKNTLLSQAKFAHSLSGKEDVIVVELGEGAPGDVGAMVRLTHPDYAVVTGLAPNHLDRYKSLEGVANDFEELLNHVGHDKAFMNMDSPDLMRLLGTKGVSYSQSGFDGWEPKDIRVDIDRLSFKLEKKTKTFGVNTNLIGRHTIGPLAFVIGLCDKLGLETSDVLKKIQNLEPYEHRMQPRRIHGAWFIDDTYNGNIEGMLAGLAYLKEIETVGRKIYVTPGLVEQGSETEDVHTRLGAAIADCSPDRVYLMRNSVQPIIERSLSNSGYAGRVTIVDDALGFYVNIQDVLAREDVMLCQNDLPDQYH